MIHRPPSFQIPRRFRPLPCAPAVFALAILLAPRPAQGQWIAAAAGAVGGAVTGVYTSTGIYVARARTGHFLYSLEEATEVRLENLPMIAGPIVGAAVGWHSGAALGAAAVWGSVGFVGTGVIGAGVGHLIWGTPEGRWAGAIIGSAAGLLIGATLGARSRWNPDDDGTGALRTGVSLPTPFEEP